MKHTNSICLVLLAAWLFCPILNAADQKPPIVLATIKPLHSIVFAVTDGVSTPELLLDGNISPHLFQVKPSHIKAVSDAEVVVWAGEGIERFLPSMIDKFNPEAELLGMVDFAEVKHLARDKHSEQNHEQGELDYHLWLDPQNAIGLANMLATKLSGLDPHNADHYKRNAANFRQRLAATDEGVKNLLSVAEGSRYLIYHDSLQYLENAYGLGDAIIVAPQPQVQAGGKQLRALHNAVSDQHVGCLISEPQFRSPVVTDIAENLGVQPVLIDPLATDYKVGKDLYPDWLADMASTLADCFASTDAVK